MGWKELAVDEWRLHPLNKLHGWLILVILLLFIKGPLQGAIVLAGAVA